MSYVAVLGVKRKMSNVVHRRRSLKWRLRLGMVSLTSVTIALGVILSILYFIQVNKMTMAVYKISDLEKEISAMSDTNEKLQSAVAEYTSLDRIEKVAREELGMVETGQVNYWWNAADTVAQR
jgi:cell division protein FtsL